MQLRKFSPAGDTMLAEWQLGSKAERARARKAIEELIAGGSAVFEVAEGEPATKVKAGYEPGARDLIAVAPLVGG